MQIIQISDLHCGGGEVFLRDKLQRAVDEINELDPNFVVITGDITDNGFKNEYEEAKRFLDQIKHPKIITSGNHDFKYTGYMIFEDMFGSPSGFMEDEACIILYVNTARPDHEDGRVSREQLKFLDRHIGKRDGRIKILAMHHHLIPVPDTGLEKAIVSDAGDVLKEISNLKFDLVLGGHRHRPWWWKLGEINFLFSGAVSTRRLRGFFENSYNIIRCENGRLDAHLKIVGGKVIDFEEICHSPYMFGLTNSGFKRLELEAP